MQKNQSSPAPPSADELNEIRTFLALDRTLLAWVRTAVTLIGFGFTIAKFLRQVISKAELIGIPPLFPLHLGFVLVSLGILGLAGGVMQYIAIGKRIPRGGSIWSPTILVTAGLFVLSLWLLGILLLELKVI